MTMSWERLLCKRRLGSDTPNDEVSHRTEFQRDYDRVVFSSAFRRLQDKTQVFPLAESDYVRTRLTHSLEVSCVGRSLGTMVGERIDLPTDVTPGDVGAIVAAAGLLHDIGNPPFGHSGEDAIREWFASHPEGRGLLDAMRDEAERQDFLRYEGNAQGFRTVARLQSPDNPGGLQLTCATLGAFFKYPRQSHTADEHRGISNKKFGFFQAERELFLQVAGEVGLLPRVAGESWQRHPLAFLVEAADDICYRIVDFEDAFRQGHLSYAEAERHLAPIARASGERLAQMASDKARIEYLRAKAISHLISVTVEAFVANQAELLQGRFDRELLACLEPEVLAALEAIRETSIRVAYDAAEVVQIETAGFEVIGGLLQRFLLAANDVAANGKRAAASSRMILKLLPDQFLGAGRQPQADPYQRAICIADFVAGMTDGYAVSLFKKMSGISLPHA